MARQQSAESRFAADVTLAAPGTKITFESLCSANTETVNWTFAGADIETAEGESVSVSYPEEGIYSVKVTAVNKAGSIEKEKKAILLSPQMQQMVLYFFPREQEPKQTHM